MVTPSICCLTTSQDYKCLSKITNWYTNIIMKAIKADPQLPEIIAAASNSASDELAVSFKLTAIRSIEDR